MTGGDLTRARWIRSSRTGGGGQNCVEVAALPGGTRAVRDSKDPDGPALRCGPTAWHAFAAAPPTR